MSLFLDVSVIFLNGKMINRHKHSLIWQAAIEVDAVNNVGSKLAYYLRKLGNFYEMTLPKIQEGHCEISLAHC